MQSVDSKARWTGKLQRLARIKKKKKIEEMRFIVGVTIRGRERIETTPKCKGQKNRLGGGWKLAGQLRAEAEKWNGRLWRKDREMT